MANYSTYMNKTRNVLSMQEEKEYDLIMKDNRVFRIIFHEDDIYEIVNSNGTKAMSLAFNIGIDFLIHLNEKFNCGYNSSSFYDYKIRPITKSQNGNIKFTDWNQKLNLNIINLYNNLLKNKNSRKYMEKYEGIEVNINNYEMKKVNDLAYFGISLILCTRYDQFFDNDKIVSCNLLNEKKLRYNDIKMSHNAFDKYSTSHYIYHFNEEYYNKYAEYQKYYYSNILDYTSQPKIKNINLTNEEQKIISKFENIVVPAMSLKKLPSEKIKEMKDKYYNNKTKRAFGIIGKYDNWYDNNIKPLNHDINEFKNFDSINPMNIENIQSEIYSQFYNFNNNYKLPPSLIIMNNSTYNLAKVIKKLNIENNEYSTYTIEEAIDIANGEPLDQHIIKNIKNDWERLIEIINNISIFQDPSIIYIDPKGKIIFIKGLYKPSTYSYGHKIEKFNYISMNINE